MDDAGAADIIVARLERGKCGLHGEKRLLLLLRIGEEIG
jgi:hypothetical protein